MEKCGMPLPEKLQKLAAAGAAGERSSNIERDILRQLNAKAR